MSNRLGPLRYVAYSFRPWNTLPLLSQWPSPCGPWKLRFWKSLVRPLFILSKRLLLTFSDRRRRDDEAYRERDHDSYAQISTFLNVRGQSARRADPGMVECIPGCSCYYGSAITSTRCSCTYSFILWNGNARRRLSAVPAHEGILSRRITCNLWLYGYMSCIRNAASRRNTWTQNRLVLRCARERGHLDYRLGYTDVLAKTGFSGVRPKMRT